MPTRLTANRGADGFRGTLQDLFVPDSILPAQLIPSRPMSPERRLLLAVLEDAVDAYDKAHRTNHERALATRAELTAWFTAEDRAWTFSFANICEALGLDADYLLAGILKAAGHIKMARDHAGNGAAKVVQFRQPRSHRRTEATA